MRTKHFPECSGQANGLKDVYTPVFVNMLFTRGEELMVANRIQVTLNRSGGVLDGLGGSHVITRDF